MLYNLTEAIVIGASLLHSFMPETSEKILRQLNTQKRPLDRMEQFGLYPSGSHVTEKPEILFARMDIKEVLEKVEKIQDDGAEKSQGQKDGGAAAAHASGNSSQDGASGSGSARDGMAGSGSSQDGTTGGSGQDDTSGHVIDLEAKPEITYDDFAKLQFQVGEIIACEAVPKSKKLLCSQVKVGSQVRQILSGIKAHYSPEEMVGKKVMVVTNLKPAKLAGMMSEGMLLCAEDMDGNLALMKPEKDMPAGAEIC